MKKLGFILLFLISVCVQNSFAQKNGNSYSNTTGKYNWGLGLRLGDPAGFTAKKYQDFVVRLKCGSQFLGFLTAQTEEVEKFRNNFV